MTEQPRQVVEGVDGGSMLRTYPLKKADRLLLACGKCQRKLKGNAGELGKLRKPLKRLSKAQGAKLLVVNTPCLKVCPKGAVVVCTAEQMLRGEFSLVSREDELGGLARAALVGVSPFREQGG